jgi:hypothetical protein
MPLARFDSPFEHPDWIFEPKLDGFRAVAYVEGGICRLVSRNRNAFKTLEPLALNLGIDRGNTAGLEARPAHSHWWPRSCAPGRRHGLGAPAPDRPRRRSDYRIPSATYSSERVYE